VNIEIDQQIDLQNVVYGNHPGSVSIQRLHVNIPTTCVNNTGHLYRIYIAAIQISLHILLLFVPVKIHLLIAVNFTHEHNTT
jgi:hypothetical protein